MGTLRFASGNSLVGRAAALVAAVSYLLLAALLCGPSSAQATIKTFNFTGGEQTFVVPSGVHLLQVRLIGGAGGEGGVASGGAAAEVTGDLEVNPGETLYIEVGGLGEDSGEGGEGGFNGGAVAGGGGGGGGGASDIRLLPRSTGLATDSRLVVAAGGGGAAGDGESSGGGAGGDAGSAGETSEGSNEGGGAGTESAGGGGGGGCSLSGTTGELGSGGSGGGGFSANGGGGGAGGFYGGGGGGGGCSAGGGGGGGGSSLVPAGGELEIASASAAPEVEISYTPPPVVSITSPTGGATYTLGQSVTAIYSCTPQEGAGLVECAGPVANGAPLDTSTVGQHTFTVNAEDTEGGTSSKTVNYTVLTPAPSGSAVPAGGAPSGSTGGGPPPNTIIDSHPRKLIKTAGKRVKVKFSFHSTAAGASFECKLDKAAYAACSTPKRYKVKAGKHKFSVRAVKDGRVDPTPASFEFKVVKTS
jgi:hypothetical protein